MGLLDRLLPSSSRPPASGGGGCPSPLRPRVLHAHEAVRALGHSIPPKTRYNLLAFYSSVLGGIVTDPALMVLPIDEHMVHRGHAVFDTANVTAGGRVYGLEMHLDRLLRSAGLARIKPAFTKEELREIVLATVAAAQEREGIFVRFWMSAGKKTRRRVLWGCGWMHFSMLGIWAGPLLLPHMHTHACMNAITPNQKKGAGISTSRRRAPRAATSTASCTGTRQRPSTRAAASGSTLYVLVLVFGGVVWYSKVFGGKGGGVILGMWTRGRCVRVSIPFLVWEPLGVRCV